MEARDALTLLDWKRRIFELYSEVRAATDPRTGWLRWREARDEMFATHPQSPLPSAERSGFRGLEFFDYDPDLRIEVELQAAAPESYEIPTSAPEPMTFERVGTLDFELKASACRLEVYWLGGYGGGLFVPFRDATSGVSTYGAGRYLLDTIKGADLGTTGTELILDFNFAYNPSCAYDPRWVCPLAPPPNRLGVTVEAGEKI